jgi:hypothetical protein
MDLPLLEVEMDPQPTITTCGPTALHAIYRYWGDDISLEAVIEQTQTLEQGGTLGVLLGAHALRRGYQVLIYSFNISLLDPTWFNDPEVDIRDKLAQQAKLKPSSKIAVASHAYREFLELGGSLRMEDMTHELVARHLRARHPLLTGVSSTYLYGCARELPNGEHHDIEGEPQGHFVVVTGTRADEVHVADPWPHDGVAGRYSVSSNRFINAALLGVVTYDGNVLVIYKEERSQ